MGWQNRFDRLLKAMSQGEPHKAEERTAKAQRKGNNPQDIDPKA
jgi:hypothetical protein